MKIKSLFSILFIISIFFVQNLIAQQQKEDFKPLYVTITKLHNTSTDIDLEEWKGIEQEFFDKITNKIDLIVGHEILINYNKKNETEVILINMYKSWDDIEKTKELRKQLIEKAWPNKEARYAFFEKQNKDFKYYYSNEIFISTSLAKYMNKEDKNKQKEPLLYYIIKNKLSDYEYDDSLDAYRNYIDNVTYKNPYIKAYLTYKHYVGSDSRDFFETYVVGSLTDLQKSLDKDRELFKKYIPNEIERKEFLEVYYEGIDDVSDVGIYMNIPSMSK